MALVDYGARLVLQFFVYAAAGWAVEVVYAALKERRLVNRGFLCGPVCPIYGIGMIALTHTLALLPFTGGDGPGWLETFVVGAIVTTLIELIGGIILYKLYDTRWWDYSRLPGNIGGYICPQFTLLWGLGSMVMVKLVHPALLRAQTPMPLNYLLWIDGVLLVIFIVDVAVSTAAAIGLNRRLKQIDEMRRALRASSDKLTELLGTSAMTADTLLDEQKLQLALAAMEGRDNVNELKDDVTRRAAALREKLEAVRADKFGARRLLRAFPDMKSHRYAETLAATRRAVRMLSERARRAAASARDAAENAVETAQTTAKNAVETAQSTAKDAVEAAQTTAKNMADRLKK